MLKKLVIVLISVVVSLFFAEVFLRVFDVNVKQLDNKNNFTSLDLKRFIKTAYIDIYEPFFKIQNGYFKIQRNNIWRENDLRCIEEYRLDKQKNKKRIFIVGESTADVFDRDILKKELSEYFNVEIINCGMSSYDSYRIERVTRDIKKLNPDWVIFLIGNNVGQFVPIMINPLPYKYKIIDKIRVFNILSNLLYPNVLLMPDVEEEQNFHNNIKKILKNLKNTKVIFVDLPNNEDNQEDDSVFNIARKCDNLSCRDNGYYNIFLSRIEFLKTMSNNNNIFVTNLTAILKNYTDDKLGYNLFYDGCHFSTATYKLLSQLITQIIVQKELNKKIDTNIDKNKFMELLKYDHSFICKTSFNNFGIQKCYNIVCADFEKKYNDFKNGYNNDYLTLVLFLNSLYDLKPENSGEIKIKLKELSILRAESFEAPLLLAYIYYREKNYVKSNEYLNHAQKLKPDYNDIKYLSEKINES